MSGCRPSFEATIVPHRSLGRGGLRWVACVLGALSLVVSVGLWALGAWPVIGFTGLEVSAAVFLLRRHALAPRGSELLILSEAGLAVIQIDSKGRRSERQVQAAWLRACLEERPGRAPALMLRGGRVALEVAAALGEAEKRSLAESLEAALNRQRRPLFENPQLRDG